MVDLKCKLTNCKYNKNCNCTAKEISVDKAADCKSFEKVKVETAQKDQIPMPLMRSSTNVNCNAECIFKKNGMCIANGITVCDEDGTKTKASCSTFMPR